jgi:Phox homology (PX) domain protein
MMNAENGETAVGTPPPPAYESIQFSRDADGADALPDVPRGDGSGFITNERVEVSVTNPTKVGDGLTAYAVYTVSTKNDDPAYKKDQSIVVRRYSDFQWLRGRLSTLYPGIVLFPLPEKTVTTSPFQSDFLEHRRSGFGDFFEKSGGTPGACDV